MLYCIRSSGNLPQLSNAAFVSLVKCDKKVFYNSHENVDIMLNQSVIHLILIHIEFFDYVYRSIFYIYLKTNRILYNAVNAITEKVMC